MYDRTDPRSNLAAAAPKAVGAQLGDAQYGLFYRDAPAETDANGKTWYTRGANFVIAYSEATPGATFERTDQVDEYMVLLPEHDTPVVASAGAQEERSDGYALLILPPGQSRLVFPKGGVVVRIFSAESPDLVAKCPNADAYAKGIGAVPPLQPWPDPPAGFKIRLYSLDVPPEPGRFGSIWRCTTLMVNVAPIQTGERDLTKVSPHHHDDFEQCSLVLDGTWRHHMRWPWSVDLTAWRPDAHVEVGAPSVTVIPAQVIHTSTYHSAGTNQLVDIFAPPRIDFSNQPGWVLNADEYPMPAKATN
jgi:mannose-6-phosphate isomerase-like protein (cupin superfamily)